MNIPVKESPSVITKKDSIRIKKLITGYNMIANVIWSVLSLVPVSVFCYHHVSLSLVYAFLIVSLLAICIPKSFFRRIELARTVYKKTGVLFINRFTQNGTIINGIIRRKVPAYKVVFASKLSVQKLLQQTYMYEKFHFILFIFFNLAVIYALVKAFFVWAVLISMTNLVYNVYPILLQQYIRIRLTAYSKKGAWSKA